MMADNRIWKIAVLPVKNNKIKGMEQKSNMELLHFKKNWRSGIDITNNR